MDFVDIGIGSLRFYTFNVADMAISLSLILLVLLAIKPSLAGNQDAPARPSTTGPVAAPNAPNAHPRDGDA